MAETAPRIALTVETFPEYVSGFPMLVAVEVRNTTAEDTFLTFPEFDLFDDPPPVEFVLGTPVGDLYHWPSAASRRFLDEEPSGVALRPRAVWRALVDLGERHPEVDPGTYQVRATFRLGSEAAEAPPVPIRVVAAVESDRDALRRLRRQNDLGDESWIDFVKRNWSTPDFSVLSAEGRQRLSFYAFLHRAAYGPQPIAALDPRATEAFARGPLEAEAAVLRLEIHWIARGAEAAAADAAALRQRWPGLDWRIRQIESGFGRLTVLRRYFGVEREDAPADQARPYAETGAK